MAVGQLVVTIGRLGWLKVGAASGWSDGESKGPVRICSRLSDCPSVATRLDSTPFEHERNGGLVTDGAPARSDRCRCCAGESLLAQWARRAAEAQGERDREGKAGAAAAATHDQRPSPPITAPVCTATTRRRCHQQTAAGRLTRQKTKRNKARKVRKPRKFLNQTSAYKSTNNTQT